MFPLSRLDPKNQYGIFQNFKNLELFNISLCSGKSLHLAKSVMEKTRGNSEFTMDLDENLKIIVGKHRKKVYNNFTCENFSATLECDTRLSTGELDGVPYLQGFDLKFDMNLYWENEEVGFQKLSKHLLNLYNFPKISLVIDLQSNNVVEMVDFVQKATKIHLAEVSSWAITDNLITEVLDKLTDVNELYLSVEPGPIFVQTFREYKYNHLTISNAFWITWQHLLTFNSKIVELEEAKLSSQDINLYLKEMVKGACPNVEKIELEMSEIDLNGILTDIYFRENPWSELLGIVSVSYSIRRNDGTFGAISISYPADWELEPVTSFKLKMEFWKSPWPLSMEELAQI